MHKYISALAVSMLLLTPCAMAQGVVMPPEAAAADATTPAGKLKQWSYTCPEVEGMRPIGYGQPNNPANKHHHLGKIQTILDRVVDSGKIFTAKDIEAIKKEIGPMKVGLQMTHGAQAEAVQKKIEADLMALCKAYNKSVKK